MVRTRLAPTPSGYLHQGNALNFVIVDLIADQFEADIALRLDDIDLSRTREEYVEDVFNVLHWLEIDWSFGPRDSVDSRRWSQHERCDSYTRARDQLHSLGEAYACTCTRSDWQGYDGDECPGACRLVGLRFEAGVTAMRAHLSDATDPVIWRRDDIPAYHLTTIVDDHEWGIGLVVRGEDLRESTQVQQHLSRLLPENTFAECSVLHHDLITKAGRKLSKSAGAGAVPMERSDALRDDIRQAAAIQARNLMSAPPRSFGN